MEHVASLIRTWTVAALDLVFPPVCLVCGTVSTDDRRDPLCGPCWRSFATLPRPWCDICGVPFWTLPGVVSAAARLLPCGACLRNHPAFTYARAAGLYEGALKEALHAFKFSGKTALAAPLGEFTAGHALTALPDAVDVVIPVPLHSTRERERGFNQAALLADRVAHRLAVPIERRVLRRIRATRVQTELTGRERQANVRSAFAVRGGHRIEGRRVLLVDDVFTTGATVSACARVLRAAGAAAVGVLTVARVA